MKLLDHDRIPATLDEAAQRLYDLLEPGDFARIRALAPHEVHHTMGTYLRNSWLLWQDTPLVRDIRERFKIFGHGDDCSAIILHCLWEKVIGNPPWVESGEHSLQALVDSFKAHWRDQGMNPETGEEL